MKSKPSVIVGRSAVPTHDELTERLNSLKELPPGSSRSNLVSGGVLVARSCRHLFWLQSSIPPLDKRTTEEKTADLLKQITNEVDLDKNSSTPFDDIEERLARLKGE